METYGQNEVKLHVFLNMALDGPEQTLVPTELQAGWTPEPE